MGIAFIGRWLSRFRKLDRFTGAGTEVQEPGEAEVLFSLGDTFADEDSKTHDPARALECYEKAASLGHAGAQCRLGVLYGQGGGSGQDEELALQWLCKAANQGHAEAQYHLGVRQTRASRVPQADTSECRAEAFKWLELATAQHFTGAEMARDFVAMQMTRKEIVEGGRRAVCFALAMAKVIKPLAQ